MCELSPGAPPLVFDPNGRTAAGVGAEEFEFQCGASITRQIATMRACNGWRCEERPWTVGAWGPCMAQCGAIGDGAATAQSVQMRTVQCNEALCTAARPPSSRSCTVPCDACVRPPCSGRGSCGCGPLVLHPCVVLWEEWSFTCGCSRSVISENYAACILFRACPSVPALCGSTGAAVHDHRCLG